MALIKQMAAVRAAKENTTWGAERILADLNKLGVELSKSSIQKYMKGVREHCSSKQTWATFLQSQPVRFGIVTFSRPTISSFALCL